MSMWEGFVQEEPEDKLQDIRNTLPVFQRIKRSDIKRGFEFVLYIVTPRNPAPYIPRGVASPRKY